MLCVVCMLYFGFPLSSYSENDTFFFCFLLSDSRLTSVLGASTVLGAILRLRLTFGTEITFVELEENEELGNGLEDEDEEVNESAERAG